MNRKAVIWLTVGASLLCLLAVSVEAQRRTRRGRRPPAAQREQAAPQSKAIAPALGELRWGMEPRAVHEHFAGKIRLRFRDRLAKAPGTIEEERVRAQLDDALRELRRSYTRFDGQRSGWDVSFLRGEFTHGNRESMMVYRDDNSQNFYLFIQGRLWKWYKAFDASVFHGQSFEQFAAAVQGRFGPAVERSGRLTADGPEQRWLEWQDGTTRLRAVDQTRFYGFYCLVFEEKATLDRLAELRTNTQASASGQGHALVESVVVPEGQDRASDDHADIVDRITGQRRTPAKQQQGAAQGQQQGQQPQQQQGQTSAGARGSAGARTSGSTSASGSARGGSSLSLDDL